MQPEHRFADRTDAGKRLAAALGSLDLAGGIVLALPRGGVPVAYEVATALALPLDILIVRKLGAPGYAEFGIGAVTDGDTPQVVLNEEARAMFPPDSAYVREEADRQLEEIRRRRKLYVGDRPAPQLRGRTAIVVDDGIATGGTVKAALRALRNAGVGRLILAVPVAPADALNGVRQEADEVVCLRTPSPFRAVGLHYERFEQTSDEEVIQLLEAARDRPQLRGG